MRSSLVAAAVLLLLSAAAAPAIEGALDDVPAPFLILPYFEVDLEDANGPQTVLTVHNASSDPILADVGLLTDWGLETLRFTVFLAGHAVREIDLRDVFLGRYPDAEPVAFCPSLGPIDPDDLAGAVAAHRGEASSLFGGQCAGQAFGDGLLRGLGVVLFPALCTLDPPLALQGVNPADTNILWGDYTLIERAAGVAVGELLPALEAFSNGFAGAGGTTSGSNPFSIERPPPVWGVPYAIGDDAVTEVIAMRVPLGGVFAVPCGSSPAGFPLGQMELTVFDDDADNVSLDLFRPFPLATNRAPVGVGAAFPVPFDSGWMRIDFRNEPFAILNGGGGGNPAFSYVAALQRRDGSATLQRAIALPLPVAE